MASAFRYVVCDVFTDRPLAGNPLAVFTDARTIPEALLQPLAREISFPETVFVYSAAAGDISLKAEETSNDFIAWADRTLGTFHPSPLVYQGCYYVLHDRGFLTCNDPATGKAIYGRQRISTDTATFTASPWAYNGKVFALSEDGDTYVVQAGPEYKVLGKNSLNEMALATPAVAGGSLIVRTASKLYRISRTN